MFKYKHSAVLYNLQLGSIYTQIPVTMLLRSYLGQPAHLIWERTVQAMKLLLRVLLRPTSADKVYNWALQTFGCRKLINFVVILLVTCGKNTTQIEELRGKKRFSWKEFSDLSSSVWNCEMFFGVTLWVPSCRGYLSKCENTLKCMFWCKFSCTSNWIVKIIFYFVFNVTD